MIFMGDLIGIDASFEYGNNVRLLLNYKVNSINVNPIKIITNSVIYKINCFIKETKISEISN